MLLQCGDLTNPFDDGGWIFFCGGDDGGQAEACWTGIPVATTQGEQSYIKGNTKYMAVAVQVISLTSSALLDFGFVSVVCHPGKCGTSRCVCGVVFSDAMLLYKNNTPSSIK